MSIIGKVDQQVADFVPVRTGAGVPVTDLENSDFTKILHNPVGTEVSGTITVTVSHVGNGNYLAVFTPEIVGDETAIGTWYLELRNVTHFPEGKGNTFTICEADLNDILFLLKAIKNEKVLEKTGETWYLIIYDNDGETLILNKAIKDRYGEDITDLEAGELSRELLTSV